MITDLLNNLAPAIGDLIDQFIKDAGHEGDMNFYMNTITTLHLVALERIIQLTKQKMGTKSAKQLREHLRQRLQAIQLDEIKTND